ncbi:MAG: 16S rRNA (cytosine(967)-C(5))-methyltransferase RsmB [Ignavibacteriaceae bacterium]|nr:16S rRNA (cytosine(967)-C(5))-methyltransferase RsmB [Ignavibacteriaceae bacterium]
MELEEHTVKEIYQGVRGIAVKVLDRIERTDSYLEKLLDYEIKNAELTGADKALLYEIVHGVVRWMGRLDWILSGFYKGQFSKAIPNLKNALRVALYQVMFLDKVPEYAIVNEAVDFVKKLQGQKRADITNAVLRNIIRSKHQLRYPDPDENLLGYLVAYYSHPAWLVKRWLERYGRQNAESLMHANNERPYLTLKMNNLKVSEGEFESLLDSVGLKFTKGVFLKEYYKLNNLTNIKNWQYFQEGYFNVQDESAGIACKLLDPKPGERVLDLCAAPGGKSAFIADLMDNKGEIVAVDKFELRNNQMDTNLKRLGVNIVKTVTVDAFEFEDEQLFDKVILDAPCSGLGTLSKKPDIKWKKDMLDIRKLAELQTRLIQKASTLVKPGGVLVYSTCTIEPEENIEIVQKFLNDNKDFEIEHAGKLFKGDIVTMEGFIQTLPHLHKIDGAFSARLIKKIV